MPQDDLHAFFTREQDRILGQWMELLRFPSISTDPAHHADCLACADWLVHHLHTIGFDNARLLPTPGKPVVFAERRGLPGKPVVLFYGHYDVQPVDPIANWTSPPFQPTRVDGRVRARGAEDNKGQHFYALTAMEALIGAGKLDATVKILLEGEEECGSGGLSAAMDQWGDLLKADVLLITDMMAEGPQQPTITLGLRGMIHLTVEVTGARHDLHSGVHGGVAPNPAIGLARLLSTLHDDQGHITVNGFGDAIRPPTGEERDLAGALAFDAAAYERQIGVPPTGGERDLPVPERLAFRPAIEINGLRSGFDGPGTKTIIPARAMAKLTARLAAGQDPAASLAAIERHLHAHLPAGLSLVIPEKGVGGPGFRLRPDSPWIQRARNVLRAQFGREPTQRWEGASIPVIAGLWRVSGAEPLLAGFGLEEDCVHAPNESFGIEQFHQGFLYVATFLSSI